MPFILYFFKMEKFLDRIINGDCNLVLDQIPENSISLIITSPPYYKQRDYGEGIGNEKSAGAYVVSLLSIMKKCLKILKHDGSIVFNMGDKYLKGSLALIPFRFAIKACDDLNIKLVNNITWVKLNPTPRQFKKRMVSSTEPFFHFVKSKDYYYDIDSFNKKSGFSRRKANSNNNIGKKYFELIKNSLLNDEQKRLALSSLKDVIKEVKSGKIESIRMKIRGIHSEPFGGQEGGRKIQLEKNGFTIIKIKGNNIKKDVIESPVETLKFTDHPAIYPVFIIKEFIKLLTRPNEIVLDPFVGSGTTAVAARELNRSFIGIELNKKYCKIAKNRIKNVKIEPKSLDLLL